MYVFGKMQKVFGAYKYFFLDCYSYEAADKCDELNGTFFLRVCYNSTEIYERNLTTAAMLSIKRPPAEEYFT